MKKNQNTVVVSTKALALMLSPMIAAPAAAAITCGLKQVDVPMAGRTTVVISSDSGLTSIGSFTTNGTVVSVAGDILGPNGTDVAACFNVAAEFNTQCTVVFDTSVTTPDATFTNVGDISPSTMTCGYTALPVELEKFEVK